MTPGPGLATGYTSPQVQAGDQLQCPHLRVAGAQRQQLLRHQEELRERHLRVRRLPGLLQHQAAPLLGLGGHARGLQRSPLLLTTPAPGPGPQPGGSIEGTIRDT